MAKATKSKPIIKRREVEEKIEIPAKPIPVLPNFETQTMGGCLNCGKPLAPGQNYVCKDHIKAY